MITLPRSNLNIDDITIGIDDTRVSHSYGGALNFGFTAPGSQSSTLIIQLKVNGVSYISNIRLALINTYPESEGEIIYKISKRDFIDTDLIPEQNILQSNPNKDRNSQYNIPIGNINNIESEFVYINYLAPNSLSNFTIKYMWFFNHDKSPNGIQI